jgi:hypothetical protein
VTARHETLRTVFPEADGSPRQLVLAADDVRPELPVLDVVPAELDAALTEAGRRASTWPASRRCARCCSGWRARGARAAAGVHHIAATAGRWPRSPVTSRSPTRPATPAAPAWEPLPVQYADYTLWQREVLGDEDDAGSALARQASTGAPRWPGCPRSWRCRPTGPGPPSASHRGGTVPFDAVAPSARTARRAGARRPASSLFMVLQAALAALLTGSARARTSRSAAPIAGRTDDALDDLVGFFVNTLVLRTDTSGDPTFRELVGRVRETDLAAYANQDVPFERLVEVLNPAVAGAPPAVPGDARLPEQRPKPRSSCPG